MSDIHDPVADLSGLAHINNASKAEIGNIQDLFVPGLVGKHKSKRSLGEKKTLYITVGALKDVVRFVQFDRPAALGTFLLDQKAHAIPGLKPFSTLIAKGGIGQVFSFAVGADFFPWFFIRPMAAFGAEPGIGRQVFAAVSALVKDQLLVTAVGTEFGFF